MSIFKLIIFITWKYLLKIKYISYSILYRQNNNLSSNLKIQNTLKKNGYVVIKNFLSRSNCKKIINDIDTYFSKNNTYWVDKEKSDKRIFGSENISKLILDFH